MRLARWLALWPMLLASAAMADVYQWQWVDPSDHSLGKTQSTTLCPGGAGVTAGRGSVLGQVDLTQAYLYARDLSFSTWINVQLDNAYLRGSNLDQTLLYFSSARGADFSAIQGTGQFRSCDLTGADFTDAKLKHFAFSTLDNANFTRADLSNGSIEQGTFYGANFTDARINGLWFYGATIGGFTEAQLRQTASYKNHDLTGISFHGINDMSGWDFSGGINLSNARFVGVKLTGARFEGATLSSTDFLNADVSSADFSGASMRYSFLEAAAAQNAKFTTADLSNATLEGLDLRGASLQGATLTNADVSWGANLTGANLTDATILRTSFYKVHGLTASQIYSTASYKSHDLRGVNLSDLLDNPDMTGWDFSSQNLTGAVIGGAGAILRNANLSGADLTNAGIGGETLEGANFSGAIIVGAGIYPLSAQQLYSTASYQAGDLRGVRLAANNMSGWDLSGVNLTDANVAEATLAGANFSGAAVTGMNFSRTTERGFTASQLYSTASYQAHDLHDMNLNNDDVSGWDLHGVKLNGAAFENGILRLTNLSAATLANANLRHAIITDADLTGADLSGADLTNADLRGASGASVTSAITKNAILPDGTIAGLQPDSTIPKIKNYSGARAIPIHITTGWDVRNTVELLFDDQPWGSTISFDPGIPILIDGTTLQLEFDRGVDGTAMVGRTFHIFDWTGVTPDGEFSIYSQFWVWDSSQLYTAGTVRLVSEVPEPTFAHLCAITTVVGAFALRRHR